MLPLFSNHFSSHFPFVQFNVRCGSFCFILKCSWLQLFNTFISKGSSFPRGFKMQRRKVLQLISSSYIPYIHTSTTLSLSHSKSGFFAFWHQLFLHIVRTVLWNRKLWSSSHNAKHNALWIQSLNVFQAVRIIYGSSESLFPDTHTHTPWQKRSTDEPIHLLKDDRCCLATLACHKSNLSIVKL